MYCVVSFLFKPIPCVWFLVHAAMESPILQRSLAAVKQELKDDATKPDLKAEEPVAKKLKSQFATALAKMPGDTRFVKD